MDYEYLALTWSTNRSELDSLYGDDMRELLDERWEEVCRAPFEPRRIGGACIMRRPKDEPRKREQHGVARDLQERLDEIAAQYDRRMRAAQEIRRHEDRAKRSMDLNKDEPRMWTKTELQQLIRDKRTEWLYSFECEERYASTYGTLAGQTRGASD